MAIAKAKKLTYAEAKDILALEKEDITLPYLRSLFSCHIGEKEPKYNTYDKITIPVGRLYNKSSIESTIGKFIVNLVVLPEKYLKKYGYVNQELTKKALGKIEKQMATMMLKDELTTKEYANYLDSGEWLGMGMAYALVPTMDYDINLPIPEVMKERDRLFDEYSKEVKRGDPDVAKMIEDKVLKLAKEKITEKGNEAYDFFKAGVGAFENNYKKTSVMLGAVENPYTKQLDILKSNYIDGLKLQDYAKASNLSIIGGYSRGVATQASGYERKKISTALQSVQEGEDGSDCGTKQALRVVIPDNLKNIFLYRYIVDNGNLVLLTEENIDKYAGKEVLMRSPMFCKGVEGGKICRKCAGELFAMMGIKNIGLLNDNMAGVLLNKSMKKFHDSNVKFSKIDVTKYMKKR